jgi:hypothetical protein
VIAVITVNPKNPAPDEVIADLAELTVGYFDFDGVHRIGIVEIHRDLSGGMLDFFYQALEMGFPISQIVRSSDEPYYWDDDKLMADNATSGFNYRNIAGTNRPSLHGLGRAFDVNPRHNPFVKLDDHGQVLRVDPPGACYVPCVPGTLHANHELVVMMKEQGWEWGGDWTEGRVDYQHFQKALPEQE